MTSNPARRSAKRLERSGQAAWPAYHFARPATRGDDDAKIAVVRADDRNYVMTLDLALVSHHIMSNACLVAMTDGRLILGRIVDSTPDLSRMHWHERSASPHQPMSIVVENQAVIVSESIGSAALADPSSPSRTIQPEVLGDPPGSEDVSMLPDRAMFDTRRDVSAAAPVDPRLVQIAEAVRSFDLPASSWWEAIEQKYPGARLFAIESAAASYEVTGDGRFDGRARILLHLDEKLPSGRHVVESVTVPARVFGTDGDHPTIGDFKFRFD